jgi:putative transposase
MKYPKFKRKEKYNSFTYPQYGGFKLAATRLVLSKIGSIKIKMHRSVVGIPKQCTIIRDVDQWYCCISCEVDDSDVSSLIEEKKAVGIDVGLNNLLTLSDGQKIENPRRLKTPMQKMKSLQRSLSRKKKGSKNREKARLALAKLHRKVRNQRNDYAHKVSTKISKEYTTVVFEDLSINRMVKNHNLAQAIMDAVWGKLRLYTAYKVEKNGGQTILVNPYGTSQKCSGCSEVVKKDLSIRMHECPSCGLVLDRDHNAALNILKLGLEQAHAEKQPLLIKRISKFTSRKQEAHA